MMVLESLKKWRGQAVVWLGGRRWFLVPGLCAGLAAGWLMHDDRESIREEVRSEVRIEEGLVPVVVAGEAHQPGESLRVSRLAMREVPAAWFTGTPIRPEEVSDIEGQRVTRALLPGSPIWREDLRAASTTVSPLGEIPSGYRVIGLPADAGGGHGLIRPGQLIDLWQIGAQTGLRPADSSGIEVLATDAPATSGRLIASAIKVVAVGGRTEISENSQAQSAGGLSLLVPAPVVASIMEAQSASRLLVALRGSLDQPTRTRSLKNRVSSPIEVLIHQPGGPS